MTQPLSREAVLVGCATDPRVSDAIDELRDDSLIQQLFDPDLNDYVYTVLPITRSFGRKQLDDDVRHQETLRRRLSDYYQARDVRNDDERVVVRELRSGKASSEGRLLELATGAVSRGDLDTAERLFEDAVHRAPTSWRAAREAAEFFRHKRANPAKALQYYAQSAAHAPARGRDRGLIFREFGILTQASGELDAAQQAIEHFEAALEELPDDGITIFYLAMQLDLRNQFGRVVQLLRPYVNHASMLTREKTRPMLARALRRTDDLLSALRIESVTLSENVLL